MNCKRIVSFLLVAMLIISTVSITCVSAAADEALPFPAFDKSKANIEIGTVSAAQGSTVSVPIKIANNPGVNSVKFKISYNSKQLTLTNTRAGDVFGSQEDTGLLINPDFSLNPYFIYADGDYTKNYTKDGVIAYLDFKVSSSAAFGDTAVEFYEYDPDNFINANGENVAFTFKSGAVRVSKVTIGAPAITAKLSAKNASLISWKKVTNAKSYQIERKIDSGKWTVLASTSAISYKDNKLAAGKTYSYRVSAVADTLKSGYSAVKSVKTLASGKSTVKLASTGKKKIKISWTAVKNADGYVLYRSLKAKKGFTAIKTAGAKTRSFTNKKLKSGTKYFYKLRAYKTINGKKSFGAYSVVKSRTAR